MDAINIIEKYYDKNSELYQILINHSTSVTQKALTISKNHPELNIDNQFIYEAGMLHDIGISQTNAPSICCFGTHPYLAHGYLEKFDDDYDDFVWLCVTKSLEYHPQRPNTLIIKGNLLDRALTRYLNYTGGRMDGYASFFVSELEDTAERLDALGWSPMSAELKEKLDTNALQGQQGQEERINNTNP